MSSAVNALNERQTRAFSAACTVGAAFAIVYLLVEISTDSAITRLAYNAFPAIRPEDTKRIELTGNVVAGVKLNTLNQGVVIVMLNLWPALLMLSGTAGQKRAYAMIALMFIATASVVFASEHSSSQVALLGSAIVFALAWKWNRLVIRTLSAL